MTSVRLFVYGSLKRGGRHHQELRGSRFLSEVRTAPGFEVTTLTLGPSTYPALVAVPGSQSFITGELFEVPVELLPSLDEFEGEDYVRKAVPLSSASEAKSRAEGHGDNDPVLAYFWNPR